MTKIVNLNKVNETVEKVNHLRYKADVYRCDSQLTGLHYCYDEAGTLITLQIPVLQIYEEWLERYNTGWGEAYAKYELSYILRRVIEYQIPKILNSKHQVGTITVDLVFDDGIAYEIATLDPFAVDEHSLTWEI